MPGKSTLAEQHERAPPAQTSGAYASRLRNVFGGDEAGTSAHSAAPAEHAPDGAAHSGGVAHTDFEVTAWNASSHGRIRSFATDSDNTTVQSGGFHAGAQVRARTPAAEAYRVGFVQTLLHSRRDAVYTDVNGNVVNHWIVSRGRAMDQLTEIGSPAPWYNASLALAGGTVKTPAMDDYPWISAPNNDGGDPLAGGTWSSLQGEDRFTTWLVAMSGNDSSTIVYLGTVNWHQSWAGQFGDGGFEDFQGQTPAVGAATATSHGNPALGGEPPNAGHRGHFSSAPRTAPPPSHAATATTATTTAPTATTATAPTAPDPSAAQTAHGAMQVYGGGTPTAAARIDHAAWAAVRNDGLGSVSNATIITWARELSPQHATATEPPRRHELATILDALYHELDHRISRAANRQTSELPALDGVTWSGGPLSGTIEDIPPFSARDFWVGDVRGIPHRHRPHPQRTEPRTQSIEMPEEVVRTDGPNLGANPQAGTPDLHVNNRVTNILNTASQIIDVAGGAAGPAMEFISFGLTADLIAFGIGAGGSIAGLLATWLGADDASRETGRMLGFDDGIFQIASQYWGIDVGALPRDQWPAVRHPQVSNGAAGGLTIDQAQQQGLREGAQRAYEFMTQHRVIPWRGHQIDITGPMFVFLLVRRHGSPDAVRRAFRPMLNQQLESHGRRGIF